MPAAPQFSPGLVLSALGLTLFVIMAVLASWTYLVVKLVDGRSFLPWEPRRVVPWGPVSVLALIALYLAVAFVLGSVYSLVQYLRHGPRAGVLPPMHLLLIDAVTKLLIVAAAPAVLRFTSGASLADLGLTTRDLGKNLVRGAWACFLMLPLVYAVAFLATRIARPESHPIEKAIRQMQSPSMAVVAGLAAVVAAPIAEELLFRGVLLGWFWRIGLPKRREEESPVLVEAIHEPFAGHVDPFAGSIVARPLAAPEPGAEEPFHGLGMHDFLANFCVSFIFAGLHAAQWPAPVPLFVLSLMLGEAYRRTGSLAAPIALHATFNGLSTIAMFLMAASGVPRP